jgi:hypothetical protein
VVPGPTQVISNYPQRLQRLRQGGCNVKNANWFQSFRPVNSSACRYAAIS